MRKIIVLGAGLTGLSASQLLAERNDVLVLESSDKAGGLAASFTKDGCSIPNFYHHVFRQESISRDYLIRAGVVVKDWRRVKMSINADGRDVNFTNPVELMKFNYLSFSGRLKFALFGLQFFFSHDWSKLKGLNAESWLVKSAGSEVTKKIFRPLMFNKFGTNLKDISAEWLATRLAAREAQSYFGYPNGGINKLVAYLTENNKSKLILKAKVSSADVKKKTVTYNGKTVKYDVLINTIPMPVFLKLVRGLPDDLRRKWSKVKYIKHLSLVVAHEKPINNFYWTNVFGRSFGGVIQHTYLHDVYPFKLSFVFSYAPSDKLWRLSDEKVKTLFLKEVKGLYSDFKERWSVVTRAVYADPFADEDYVNYKPLYETGVEGFYNAGIQVTAPEYMRSMNNALMSGQVVAKKVLSSGD